MQYQTGVASVSFRSLGVDEIVKLAKEAGLDGIEWGSDVHVPCGANETAKSVKERMEANGLAVLSYGSYFRLGVSRTDDIACYLATANALGAPVMRIWAGNRSSEDCTPAKFDSFVEKSKRVAALAEQYGVVLGLECHDSTFTDDYAFEKRLLDAVNSPHFKTYWQPNRFRSFAYNFEAAKALAPYAVTIHTQRWEGDTRFFLEDFRQEWESYMDVLKATQINYNFVLEFMPDNRPESLKKEAKTLRSLLD